MSHLRKSFLPVCLAVRALFCRICPVSVWHFWRFDGDKVIKDLQPGEVLKVDTGNVVAFERSVSYEIETVKGLKNIFLGGEGLFLTRLVGPGRVILQTQNLNEFAGRIARMIPSK